MDSCEIILKNLEAGVATRKAIIPSLVPSDGIPREEADRLWLNRQYDQGTAKLRRSGVDAVSFGGRTFIVGEEMSEEDIETLERYRDREKLRAAKHQQNAARYDAVIRRVAKIRDCEGQIITKRGGDRYGYLALTMYRFGARVSVTAVTEKKKSRPGLPRRLLSICEALLTSCP